jgi:hypothetical protein
MHTAMKSVLMILLSGLFISLGAQDKILSIKSDSYEINGRLSDGFYKQDTLQYKNLISILNSLELKSQMVSKKYYLDFEPGYYETDNLIKYNTNTRSFSVLNEIEGGSFYNKPGSVQFDRILLPYPTGILTASRNVNYMCNAFIEEAISFKIENDSLALKIKENSSNLKLLFVFSFTGTNPFQSSSPEIKSEDYFLLTSIPEVFLYNSKTNEIYCTYK